MNSQTTHCDNNIVKGQPKMLKLCSRKAKKNTDNRSSLCPTEKNCYRSPTRYQRRYDTSSARHLPRSGNFSQLQLMLLTPRD